ncbi:MAG TPA: ABC transporter substrate-binding protein [Anaeromyxobacter sp.]|nr:ABC transporter substrate-binding protein [Anaeromyxobacter sp.]
MTPSPARPPLGRRLAKGPGLAVLLATLLLPLSAGAGLRPAYGGAVRILLPGAPKVSDPAFAVEPADLLLVRALHATPLEIDAQGRLVPGLLEEVPAAEAGGRAFRLRLRPGLRFADGTPLGAADLAQGLERLISRQSPHAWVALPVLGADALLAGHAASLAGVQVLSDREVLVTLAFPMPEWPWALAAPPAAVVSPGGVGAGPFVVQSRDASTVRLAVNPYHWRGRAFADEIVLSAADARAAARALSRGEAELALRPEAAAGVAACLPTPPLLVTLAAVNPRRLGSGADGVRALVNGLDRTALGRLYARGPSAPLATFLPPAVFGAAPATPAPAAPAAAVGGPPSSRLVLLASADAPDQRAVAERLQVKLFDGGVRAAAEVEDGPRFAARLAAEDYDLALVPVPVLSLAPALAAGQVALSTRGPAAAVRVMAELAGLTPEAALARAAELTRSLDLVPLFATGVRASRAAGLEGLAIHADGGLDPGDLWRRRGEAR